MKKLLAAFLVLTGLGSWIAVRAVEIPLDNVQPVRIGFVDLQRVFDTYPEKSFAEGDLLREIEKRKRELNRRQTEISGLRAQIASDEAALERARQGREVVVPENTIPEPEPAPAPKPAAAPTASTATVAASTAAAVEPYPTEDPLAGLPGHEGALTQGQTSSAALPGLSEPKKQSMLDLLAAATGPMLLNDEAKAALQSRVDVNQKRLDKAVTEFKSFRNNAVGDMKQLQTQKTYGVMAKIYAVLQSLARDEGVTVVLDKAYVLYGEDTVDLSDKLITRLQEGEQ